MSKIYELAEQAAEHAVLNPEDEVLQSETEDAKVEIPKAFIDKFAELIIRECCDLLETSLPYNPQQKMIKKHFGVEE